MSSPYADCSTSASVEPSWLSMHRVRPASAVAPRIRENTGSTFLPLTTRRVKSIAPVQALASTLPQTTVSVYPAGQELVPVTGFTVLQPWPGRQGHGDDGARAQGGEHEGAAGAACRTGRRDDNSPAQGSGAAGFSIYAGDEISGLDTPVPGTSYQSRPSTAPRRARCGPTDEQRGPPHEYHSRRQRLPGGGPTAPRGAGAEQVGVPVRPGHRRQGMEDQGVGVAAGEDTGWNQAVEMDIHERTPP